MYSKWFLLIFVLTLLSCGTGKKDASALVLMTDFGTKDGAVSAMKGVALQQSGSLQVHDLSHEIPAYDIWQGAYRLQQTAPFWAQGTVFVGVVDPGVGTERKPVVLKTKAGHYFVGPDNGLFSLVAESEGIAEIREIAKANRLPGSEASYTFHGRDVFAYTGARLAADLLDFSDVGPLIPNEAFVLIAYDRPVMRQGVITGNIPILDIQYGNVWTNIDQRLFKQLGLKDHELVSVKIYHGDSLVLEKSMPFVHSFGDVQEGEDLVYLNSLMNVSFGINMGSFAGVYGVSSGADWKTEIRKAGNSSQK